MKKVVTLVLSLLGIIGLSSECMKMYGCPYAGFSLKGKVTDENLKPLNEIGIEISTNDDINYHVLDTVYTFSDGSYAYGSYDVVGLKNIEIKAFDPDSIYLEQTKKLELTYEGGEGWYEGKAEATQDFTLKKK